MYIVLAQWGLRSDLFFNIAIMGQVKLSMDKNLMAIYLSLGKNSE